MMRPAVAILMGIFVIAMLIVLIPRLSDRSGTRGGTEARIALVSPVDTRLPKDKLEFKWHALAGTDYYTIEIFDRSLRLVWRSGRLEGTEAYLPAEVSRRVEPGETYYWTVTAATEGGREIKSRLAEFSVIR